MQCSTMTLATPYLTQNVGTLTTDQVTKMHTSDLHSVQIRLPKCIHLTCTQAKEWKRTLHSGTCPCSLRSPLMAQKWGQCSRGCGQARQLQWTWDPDKLLLNNCWSCYPTFRRKPGRYGVRVGETVNQDQRWTDCHCVGPAAQAGNGTLHISLHF